MADRFEVVVTAIVVREDKFLILRRSREKKRFPGMWTVPGGRLEISDFIDRPKESKDYWYNVLETALRREVKEESGLAIKNIEYMTSLATIHKDGAPSLVVSCIADFAGGDIILQTEETDQSAWVSLESAHDFDLIDGIYDELVMATDHIKGRKREWHR
jgi:ADP-ribose pyrophosphatase YjhB (NUDIX family)